MYRDISQKQVAGELAGEPLIEAWRAFVGSHGGTSYGAMGMVNLATALRGAGRKDEAQPLLVTASEQTNEHRAVARARLTALVTLYRDAKDAGDAAAAATYLDRVRGIQPAVADRLAPPPPDLGAVPTG